MRCRAILAGTMGMTIVLLGRSLAAEEPTARQTLHQWCEALEAGDLERVLKRSKDKWEIVFEHSSPIAGIDRATRRS